MTGNAIKRESALARFSGTTSVPQSASYSPASVLNVHGSSVSSPGFAPVGTVCEVSGPPQAVKISPNMVTTTVRNANFLGLLAVSFAFMA